MHLIVWHTLVFDVAFMCGPPVYWTETRSRLIISYHTDVVT
jgi:hypothetical protein